jgi:hypothetical protein
MLPLSQQALLNEIESAKAILDKWADKVAEGIPGVDVPMSGNSPAAERLDVWLLEMMGELQLVAGKTANIVSVLSELQQVV